MLPTIHVPGLASAPCARAQSSPVGVLRRRRRPMRVVPIIAALAAVAVFLAARPAPAEAGPIADMCSGLVDDWYSDCSGEAAYFSERMTCEWVSGIARMHCDTIGAYESAWVLLY